MLFLKDSSRPQGRQTSRCTFDRKDLPLKVRLAELDLQARAHLPALDWLMMLDQQELLLKGEVEKSYKIERL